MDPNPCVICGHNKVRKIHTKQALEEHSQRLEREKAERQAEWDLADVGARPKRAARMGKKMVQEYYCICFQIQKGSGEDACSCCVGPFTDSMREHLNQMWNDYQNGIDDESRPTVSDNAGAFINHLVQGTTQVCHWICLVCMPNGSSPYSLFCSLFVVSWDTVQ